MNEARGGSIIANTIPNPGELLAERLAAAIPMWKEASEAPFSLDVLWKEVRPGDRDALTETLRIVGTARLDPDPEVQRGLQVVDELCLISVKKHPANYGPQDLISRIAALVELHPDPAEAQEALAKGRAEKRAWLVGQIADPNPMASVGGRKDYLALRLEALDQATSSPEGEAATEQALRLIYGKRQSVHELQQLGPLGAAS